MRLNTEANRTLRCAFGLGNLVQSQTSAVFVLNHQLNNKPAAVAALFECCVQISQRTWPRAHILAKLLSATREQVLRRADAWGCIVSIGGLVGATKRLSGAVGVNEMGKQLQGRVAIVTGASSGIGRGCYSHPKAQRRCWWRG